MGWRRWLERIRLDRRAKERAGGFFDARGDDVIPTVGASFCTHEIDAVTGGGHGLFDLEVFLVHDARNLHDANAVVVHSRDARRLAYLDQGLAARYAPALDHLGADALVRATASRRATGHHWTITLFADRELLDELRAAATGEPGAQRLVDDPRVQRPA